MAGPTSRPFLKAFAIAAVAFIVLAVLIAWGVPTNGNIMANLLGKLFGATFIAAIFTGYLARRAKTAWSTVKIAVIYVAVLFLVTILYLVGKLPQK
jgi:hypothetical protein